MHDINEQYLLIELHHILHSLFHKYIYCKKNFKTLKTASSSLN